ncbi:unnamed protein product [Brassicogethes aeneus]|uniref:A-kinase anchor protein 7-like phosphoesterase domain-containing protein n=1 Tax=Brassicogethes aeneus TaxID=1431903 RepID=A0A9P0B9A3_BRAAE|nr:unnamed protein product [Brassicogethes aeneus]
MLKNIKNKPLRMWIDGKVYNITPPKVKVKKGQAKTLTDTSTEVEMNNEIQIIKENDKLRARFHLPQLYNKKLHDHFNEKEVAQKTQTRILMPKYTKRGTKNDIIIEGQSEDGIKEAANELVSAIGQTRKQILATHFISIPLLSTEIQENFNKFKPRLTVLEIEGIENMEECIFISPLKLHLTLTVFCLFEEELHEATKALQEYKEKFVSLFKKYGSLKIKVEGINIMNNNPKKVDVLYANAKITHDDEEVDLQKIVDDVSEYFYERGLCKENKDSVKLHMTLINTRYRNSDQSTNIKKRFQRRIHIDATQILEKYKDFEFGCCDFNSLHLSEMGSVGEDGFYKSVSTIKNVMQ